MSAGRVAIIIPNWNGQAHLEHCLPALAAQTVQNFEILIVDNGSTDGSVEWLGQAFPSVHIISLDRNKGFAAACNSGICATDAELIITLNNDTEPHPDWLEKLVGATEQYPQIGMFAATLWRHGDPPRIDAEGLQIDRLGVAWNIAGGEPVSTQAIDPYEIFGPCAGAALYRRQLLDDVGLFDRAYFAYLEDAELAWRARWAGWKCMAVPQAIVWHVHSATGGRNPARKFWLLGRNRIWTFLRHYPRPQLWRHLPLILLNEVLTGLLGALALRHPAPILGRLSALRHWRTVSHLPYPAPRRLSSREAFNLLCPLPSLAALWSRYMAHRHSLTEKRTSRV